MSLSPFSTAGRVGSHHQHWLHARTRRIALQVRVQCSQARCGAEERCAGVSRENSGDCENCVTKEQSDSQFITRLLPLLRANPRHRPLPPS